MNNCTGPHVGFNRLVPPSLWTPANRGITTTMKKLFSVLVFCLLFNELAYAHRGDQFLLPKFGFMDIQINNPTPLWSAGLLYGYGLTNRLSVEAETNLGFSGGEYEKRDPVTGLVIEKGAYSVSTLAAYGVYRYPLWQGGYIKTKLGLLYENVSRELEVGGTREDTDFGTAGGLGFGVMMMNRFTMELEATIIDKDIIFYSLGTHINF